MTVQGAGANGELRLRRFADTSAISIGSLSPGHAQSLALPTDEDSDPWVLSASVPVTVCGAA